MSSEIRYLLDEFGTLKQDRRPFEDVWEEIAEHVAPNRAGFGDGSGPAERHADLIFDGTPASALNMYASGSMGYLLSASFNWFSLRVPDETLMDVREVRMWLSKVEQVLYGMIQRSNFYQEMFGYFYDGGSIGTATVYRYWDAKQGRECFSVRHPREIYLAEDEHHDVDTVYRHTMLTNKQIVEAFGEDGKVHPEILADAQDPSSRYKLREVLHAVKPNQDYDPRKRDSKAMKYASWYIDVDHEQELRKKGYRIMPYASWRVQKQVDEVYGRGPGWNALADIKSLYAMAKSDMTAAQLMVNPPIDIPEERRGKYRWVPGGRNYYDEAGRPVIVPNMQLQIGAGLQLQQQKMQLIRQHYLVDFFMMFAQADAEMTATEIRQRREEKAVLLGPHISGLNRELDKIIDGLFADAWEQKMLPPPPRVLMESTQGRMVEVDYMGPLAQAQRSFFRSEPYRQALGAWNALSALMVQSGRSPDFLDNYNMDYVSRELSKAGGLPEEAMLDERKVALLRKQRQQQQAAAQQMANMEQMGKAAPGLNQPVEKGSILDEMGKQAAGAQAVPA